MAGAGYAERVNAAAELAAAGIPAAEATRTLAARYRVSARQARRYVDTAAVSGRVPVPEPSVVFTVKLPASLAVRVREHAHEAGLTISAVVAAALLEFLRRPRPRRSRR